MQESRTITQKSASNLALAFILLPKAKRDGMSALYAFCREVDDVADNETATVDERRKQLAAWRSDVSRACGTETPHFATNRELQPVIRQYRLPFEYFDELLRGVEMDLEINRFTFHQHHWFLPQKSGNEIFLDIRRRRNNRGKRDRRISPDSNRNFHFPLR